jgi:hypothetical protein
MKKHVPVYWLERLDDNESDLLRWMHTSLARIRFMIISLLGCSRSAIDALRKLDKCNKETSV